ncbi:MAG TPA: quinone oxidoreductase [Acetobacteraceae bacterium]|nr:quinone oxidoreductase [Acetobacteraceae bacterium]
MARMIRMTKPGGTDVLELADVPLPAPGPGEILVRQSAIGINFIDIYHRTGLYPLPSMPAVPGVEGAGVVVAAGPGVAHVKPGDRIAYAGAPVGAYASERLLPAARAIPLPPAITDEVAAAAMVKGLTAHMLLTRVYRVEAGTWVLVHGAAGGLGSLLTAWAKRLGARVIGTVGSGGETLRKTLACVRPFGTVASIGQPAGPIPPIDVEELGPKRSLSLARPSIMAYISDTETYRRAAADVLAVLQDGIAPLIGRSYPLAEAAAAQADLEAGRTTGSLLLVP